MRLVWTTDPHFNHVPQDAWDRWASANRSAGGDGLLISGDLSEADDLTEQLSRLADAMGVPVYFVLGNHDFYRGSIAETRRRVIEACRERAGLCYLTDSEPIEVCRDVYLLGDDGWGDGTVGDYEGTTIRLNDFALIDDFRLTDPSRWRSILQQQGRESAERLEHKLDGLPTTAREVVIVTHVPPFRESCWYQGKTTDDNWAPFFVCGQVGDAIDRAAVARPERQLTVLCGHTHNGGTAQMRDNLIVYTGGADYGQPTIEGILETKPNVVFRSAK